MKSNTELARITLTYTYALLLFIIGVDKLGHFNVISASEQFIGPVIHTLLPFQDTFVLFIEGAVEIALGILLLSPFRRVALAVLAATISLVIVDLTILHYYNLAIRDATIIVGCFVLYLLDPNTPSLADTTRKVSV